MVLVIWNIKVLPKDLLTYIGWTTLYIAEALTNQKILILFKGVVVLQELLNPAGKWIIKYGTYCKLAQVLLNYCHSEALAEEAGKFQGYLLAL